MNKIKNRQEGIAHLTIIGLVVVLAIIGFTGWRVWKVRQDSQKYTESSNNSSAKSLSNKKTEQKSTIPDGFVEYTSDEYGIKFAYPKEWGNVSVQKWDGYSTFTYEQPPKTAGTYSVTLSFSSNKEVSMSTYNSKLVGGPRGGSTLYGILGFCETGGSYSLKRTAAKTTSGSDYTIDTAKCSDEKLDNVTKLSKSNAILINKLEQCGEGGCGEPTNVLIATTSSSTFPALIVKSASLTQDIAEKIASTVK